MDIDEKRPSVVWLLLHSRKFWLAVFGVVQALVFHFLNVPDEIWQSIAGLVMVLIGAIAAEDVAEKVNR